MERVVDSPSEGPSWPSVAANRGFFVLNPEGDLTHTQFQFETTFARYVIAFAILIFRIDGWNGIVGRAPMDQEILSALRSNDIFL
jgi:separase